MGRERIYSSAAERQKAYRIRAMTPNPVSSQPPKRCPPLSRPKQLAEIEKRVIALLASYEEWQDQIPDSLESTAQAEKLADTIEKLSAVADLLADIEAPLGFGRD